MKNDIRKSNTFTSNHVSSTAKIQYPDLGVTSLEEVYLLRHNDYDKTVEEKPPQNFTFNSTPAAFQYVTSI